MLQFRDSNVLQLYCDFLLTISLGFLYEGSKFKLPTISKNKAYYACTRDIFWPNYAMSWHVDVYQGTWSLGDFDVQQNPNYQFTNVVACWGNGFFIINPPSPNVYTHLWEDPSKLGFRFLNLIGSYKLLMMWSIH